MSGYPDIRPLSYILLVENMVESKRAGTKELRTHPRLGTYEVFIPGPLPPDLKMDDQLLHLISAASDALARLDGVTQVLPNPDLFVAMYMKKEALLSSQIEGTQASLMGVLEFEADMTPREDVNDIREVLNYLKAMSHGMEKLEFSDFSLPLINEIHNFLISGTRGASKHPGTLRDVQNWIGTTGSPIQQASYVPPPPDLVQPLMEDLQQFIMKKDLIPPLIKTALIHAQFESIHPYEDGNGRMGRLLTTFFLYHRRVLSQPLLYMSYYLKKNQREYYEQLNDVRFEGLWENWIRFFLTGVIEVSKDSINTAKQIIGLQNELTNKLAIHRIGGVHAVRLVHLAFEYPILSTAQVTDALQVSRQTATLLIKKFEEAGILVEISGKQKHRRYQFIDYLRIIQSGMQE